jgi:competence protein ComFB
MMAERSLKNYMELLVWELLDEFLEQYPSVCDCEACRYDIVALALNNLPPKYIATDKGELLMRVQGTLTQNRSDVLSALIQATLKVGSNPNHQ